MFFNSYVFVLVFLPLCLIGYYGCNHIKQYKAAKVFLLGMSIWFYCYAETKIALVLGISILTNFVIAHFLRKEKSKFLYVCGLVFNIGLLFFFKYFNFTVGALNTFLLTSFSTRTILMVTGVSFFTFEQIAYLYDCYHKEVEAYSLLDYTLYISSFLYIIAGPIVSHSDMIPQLNDETKKGFDQEAFARGLYQFTLGLSKKVLIADTLALVVNDGYNNVLGLSSSMTFIVMVCYALQLYFDFSGYCDMGRGIGRMFQLDLPINFDSPYKAHDLQDFWKHWHMTLNTFFTKYVYIPLGGSRKGKARKYLNVFIIFLLSGIWHGANYTFILWGILHGIAVCLAQPLKPFTNKCKHLAVALQFLFNVFAFAIFRASSITQVQQLFGQLHVRNGFALDHAMLHKIVMPEFNFVINHYGVMDQVLQYMPYIFAFVFVVLLAFVFKGENVETKTNAFKPTVFNAVVVAVLLTWSILSLGGVNTFIYAQF